MNTSTIPRRARKVWLVLHGNLILVKGWRAGDLLNDEMGYHAVYLGSRRAWALDVKHLPDLVARLQHRNIAVHGPDPIDIT